MRKPALILALAAALALVAAGWLWRDQPRNIETTLILPPIDHLVVHKAERRMMAYAGGRLVHTFAQIQLGDAPVGHKQFEGDEKTPEGRYTIDSRNPRSRYTLSLHISYPNARDRAFAEGQGRKPGGDIFIHGQPGRLPAGRMPGDWTDGCIALSNNEIAALWRAVENGTSIEIRP